MRRTTLALEERLFERIKELARREGRYFQDCANELLRLGIEARSRGPDRLDPLPVYSLGVPTVDIADRDAVFDILDRGDA